MYLTKKQSDKFYKIFNSLIFYAIEELDILDDLSTPGGKKIITDQTAKEVSNAIWADSSIIDKFVKDNPNKLNFDELRIVRGWKNHVSGYFYMVKHTNQHTVLLQDGYAFGIVGLTEDIEGMYPELPVAVETTLLPFEGHIVYDVSFMFYPITFGPNISRQIKNDLKDATEKDSVITAESEFIETAMRIADEKRREKAGAAQKLLSPKKTNVTVPEMAGVTDNTHVGVLSGLPYEEREQAIQDYILRTNQEVQDAFNRSVFEKAYRRPPVSSLRECLSLLTKDELKRVAEFCELDFYASSRKFEYVEELTEGLPTSVFTAYFFNHLQPKQVKNLCALADAGGRLIFDDDAISSVMGYSWHPMPFVMLFHYKQKYTVVMPDEIVEIFSAVRDTIIDRSELKEEINNFASALIEVYGIVSIDVFLQIFNENSKNQIDKKTLLLYLEQITNSMMANYIIWKPRDEIYIIHYQLDYDNTLSHKGWYAGTDEEQFVDVGYVGVDSDEEDGTDEESEYYSGEEYLEYILSRHEEIKMKPLSAPELLKYTDSAYINNLPAITKLREFFDANIPADQDDYYFADKLIEQLLGLFRLDTDPSAMLEFLIESGMEFEIDKMNAMLSFIMDAANNIPKWTNNGWTGVELSKKRTGADRFDNSLANDSQEAKSTKPTKSKKTGRNEPCPCGSGKKYKNCCGKVNAHLN